MDKNIKIKRVYDEYSEDDGIRILVDRIYPRGLRKDEIKIDLWLKDIAPSNELRKWFGHEPDKWNAFLRRYKKELDEKHELCVEILKFRNKQITLIYSAKDTRHNNAVVLKDYLENNFFK